MGDLTSAAAFDDTFQSWATRAENMLVENALPAYLTHRLVTVVTECLVKEVTGQNIPLMQDMVQNIAEVYCLTDPTQPGNPIIYASLNGPDTLLASRNRLGEAVREGREACETILNYRRDGSSFLNLLMIAPLYDNKGRIRYFIGCQIDITNLVDEGRGLDSFQRLLAKEHAEQRFGEAVKKRNSVALVDLWHMLNPEEIDLLKLAMVENSDEPPSPSTRLRPNMTRRHFGMEKLEQENLGPLRHIGRW
jgi:hypothetical protein